MRTAAEPGQRGPLVFSLSELGPGGGGPVGPVDLSPRRPRRPAGPRRRLRALGPPRSPRGQGQVYIMMEELFKGFLENNFINA